MENGKWNFLIVGSSAMTILLSALCLVFVVEQKQIFNFIDDYNSRSSDAVIIDGTDHAFTFFDKGSVTVGSGAVVTSPQFGGGIPSPGIVTSPQFGGGIPSPGIVTSSVGNT